MRRKSITLFLTKISKIDIAVSSHNNIGKPTLCGGLAVSSPAEGVFGLTRKAAAYAWEPPSAAAAILKMSVSQPILDCEFEQSVAFTPASGQVLRQLSLGLFGILLGLTEFALSFFAIVSRDLRRGLSRGGADLSLLRRLVRALRRLSRLVCFLIGNHRRTVRRVG
jgi:hypothetical protein